LKVAAKHRLVGVPQFLVGYRIYADNMSSDVVRMSKAIVATIEHHIGINPALPRWAAASACGSTREYALSLLLRERRWNMMWSQFAGLARSDARRAFDVAATLAGRKLRKLAGAQETPARVDFPLFAELDPDTSGAEQNPVSGRDAKNMKKLAKLDDLLAREALIEPFAQNGFEFARYHESAF
jgi:hypothetical protein